MLSFSIKDDGRSIQIYCDKEGVLALIAALEEVRAEESHTHLFAPSRGGQDLSDKSPFGEAAVSEVVISFGGD